jgi:putative oxidoreductase
LKIVLYVIVAILAFLAISSGITKIMLMPRDVEFFGAYGFTDAILFSYGTVQLLGGVLFVWPRTRTIGAIVVAITFMVSAVVLILEGNIPVTIITIASVFLLGVAVKLSRTNTQKIRST